MKKFLGFIFVVLIILIVGLYIGRNQVVKFAIEKGVQKALDLDIQLGQVDIDFKETKIAINDLKIMNPKGYVDPLMFNMPEMHVNYNLKNIIGGKIHLEEVRLDISELVAVRNKDGELNLSVFQPKGSVSQKKESSTPTEKTETSPKDLNLQIDLASVKLGKLIFKDYSKGDQPEIQELNINLNETFEDVTDVQSIIMVIVQKALMKSAFPGLNVDFGAMTEGFSKEAEGMVDKLKKGIKIPSF